MTKETAARVASFCTLLLSGHIVQSLAIFPIIIAFAHNHINKIYIVKIRFAHGRTDFTNNNISIYVFNLSAQSVQYYE